VKAAIIGAGLMGQWHCHFAKLCGGEIVGIVDPDHAKAEALASRFGAKAFENVQTLLAEQSPVVAHICTPTPTHDQLIETCINSGANVLVEKPLASSLAETKKLLSMASERRLILNPVHQFSFQSGFQELLQRQDSLGQAVKVSFITCSAGGADKSPAERRQVLSEILPHPIGLFQRLFPEIEMDKIILLHQTDDYLELNIDYRDIVLSITISLSGRPTRNELVYIATKGTAHLDLFHGYALFEGGKVSRAQKMLKPFKFGTGVLLKAGANLAVRAARSEPAYPGLRELITRFYEAVETHGTPPISTKEILLVAAILNTVSEYSR
jgi:predicted dehydrogenase